MRMPAPADSRSAASELKSSMDDFSSEAALLESAGAGIRIHNAGELMEKILQTLADPQDAQKRGERGRAVVLANRGAAKRYAEMVIRYIG